MANRVYCTYFDHNYLSRGLALYHSLQRHAPDFRLWVLCQSELCHRILAALDLPNLRAVRLADFEAADPEVAATRTNRSRVEYYFTCSPAWMLFVLEREPSAEWVTYLDADMFFFESPNSIYDELEDAAVAIIPHRYPAKLQKLRRFGTYNVGWVGARNEVDGIAAIKWWREKCIEWCYDYVDGDRFADQGYLDSFSTRFPRVKAIEHIGANLAPWNIENYRIDFRDDKVLIDRIRPLIFFHFQGLKQAMGWFIFNNHRLYRAPFTNEVRDHIYRPYVEQLLAIEKSVHPMMDVSGQRLHRRSTVIDIRQYLESKLRTIRNRLFQLLDIVTGRAVFIFRGRVY
jgi:hypothetical protein